MEATPASPMPESAPEENRWSRARTRMTALIKARGVCNPDVLRAMAAVPRHEFLPEPLPEPADAYGDHPMPIGRGQTISQPYIVAYMTALLDVRPEHRVLEVGSGRGYQAAVLALMGAAVIGIERLPDLAEQAAATLRRLRYEDVRIVVGDGYRGCPEYAPFDRIMVSCAPPDVPGELCAQLAAGGRMVVPVGGNRQFLTLVERRPDGFFRREDLPVRFVPMVPGMLQGSDS